MHSLSQHIPAPAVDYCRQLQQYFPFKLHIVRPRRTRFGDFRVLPDGVAHITVNADLNPYAFLLTYVHEVAHCAVYQTYKRRGKPHGALWQSQFQRLMQPLLTDSVFPPDVLTPLQHYMIRPAATTAGQPLLRQALQRYSTTDNIDAHSEQLTVRDVPEGQVFQLQKKSFIRGKLRRTRIVCKDVQSGRSYAILADALVTVSVT